MTGKASLGDSKEETVVDCFRHCGMQATGTEATEDPFAKQLHPDDCMTATKYAEAKNEVATCATFEVSENWTGVVENGGITRSLIEEG